MAPEQNLVRLGLILKPSEKAESGRIGERIESTAVEYLILRRFSEMHTFHKLLIQELKPYLKKKNPEGTAS